MRADHAPAVRSASPHVVVVGAGAFGGWTAWWLARRGARVTVVDAWGPGNARASSGGETRVIRGAYGERAIYTRMAARALSLWRDFEHRCHRQLYFPTGALWLSGPDDAFLRASAEALRAAGLAVDLPSVSQARQRWPQIDFSGVSAVLLERDAGYLLARESCACVLESAREQGAEYRAAAASPLSPDGVLARLVLDDGASIAAEAFVFACGPWLGRLFPDVIGSLVRSTRQEVFHFGPTPADARFDEGTLPVWLDVTGRFIYGVPGHAHRGFKIADDTAGPEFDPTHGSRDITADGIAAARRFLRMRFPGLADAPFAGGEVCQYEKSPDSHFIIDRHPQAANVWIVGGGSGHGFKMGPALGELVASLVLSDGAPDPQFGLARFAR